MSGARCFRLLTAAEPSSLKPLGSKKCWLCWRSMTFTPLAASRRLEGCKVKVRCPRTRAHVGTERETAIFEAIPDTSLRGLSGRSSLSSPFFVKGKHCRTSGFPLRRSSVHGARTSGKAAVVFAASVAESLCPAGCSPSGFCPATRAKIARQTLKFVGVPKLFYLSPHRIFRNKEWRFVCIIVHQ